MKIAPLLCFLLFGGCSMVMPPSMPEQTKPQEQNQEIGKETATPSSIEKKPHSTNAYTEKQNQEKYEDEVQGEKNESVPSYPIHSIIDGDTLRVPVNGTIETVRILGIDTPEIDGYRTAECYGDDASEYAKNYLQRKNIMVMQSKTGDQIDRYDRLLRYVFVDGVDFGAHMISEGYARAYKKFPHDRRSYYIKLEKTAQDGQKGMWNSDNCSYWGQMP